MVEFIEKYEFRKQKFKKGDTLKCSQSVQDFLIKKEKVAKDAKEK